ncbi:MULTISPECIES: very short patch repair endonuclease [unclassified Azospirillum]|uniref:very short patch repair endonuclease n=1 Tax=unclassified Azospirillum TaxID=2630922 RepID=UPI001FCDAE9E
MSRIRAKDTKPEMLIRRGLHAKGMRYRLHRRDLPGCPDLVFPQYRAVVFVHGCFWHGHDCPLFKPPATRQEFWAAKIAGNCARDKQSIIALLSAGWRVLTIWECSMRGSTRLPAEEVLERCVAFIKDPTDYWKLGDIPSPPSEKKTTGEQGTEGTC